MTLVQSDRARQRYGGLSVFGATFCFAPARSGTSGMEGAQAVTWSIDKVARPRRRLTHGRAATPPQIPNGGRASPPPGPLSRGSVIH